MTVIHKDIGLLSQKATPAGTEKIPVSDTQYLTTAQIAALAATAVVSHGTSDTTFTLPPNALHVWGVVAALTITLGTETSGIVNEYMFEFQSGSTATTLSVPQSVVWADACGDLVPEANKTYQVSIEHGVGLWVSIDTPSA